MLLKEEAKVAKDLFDVLEKSKAEGEGAGGSSEQDEVEKARKEREEGWGGKWGRWAATGAGVVVSVPALVGRGDAAVDALSSCFFPPQIGSIALGLTGMSALACFSTTFISSSLLDLLFFLRRGSFPRSFLCPFFVLLKLTDFICLLRPSS
jgi:hypothetical protein